MHSPFLDELRARQYIRPEDAQKISGWAALHTAPLGVIAVEHGLISGTDIDVALAEHQRCRDKIGECCVRLGYLTKSDLNGLLEIQRMRAAQAVAEGVVLCGLMSFQEAASAYADHLKRVSSSMSSESRMVA